MAFQQQFPFGVNPGAGMGQFHQSMAQALQQTRAAFPLLHTVNNNKSRPITPPGNSMGAARHGIGARAYGQ